MGAVVNFREAVIAEILLNDSMVWTQLMAAGKKAEEYWKSIAPHYADDKDHKLMASKNFVVHPGDYEHAIRHWMINTGKERFVRVQDFDPKAEWVEYGSEHNEAKAPCAETRAYMLAHGFHATE